MAGPCELSAAKLRPAIISGEEPPSFLAD